MDNRKELKVEDINKSYEQKRALDDDAYWQRRVERRGNIRKKKLDSIKKNIKRSLYAASVMALIGAGELLSKKINQRQGAIYIIDKYRQIEENYDKIYVYTSSTGAHVVRVNHTNDEQYDISSLEGIRYMDRVGKDNGLSEAERYIVEADRFNGYYKEEINDYFEDVTEADIVEAKEAAYHESELEDIKGVSR